MLQVENDLMAGILMGYKNEGASVGVNSKPREGIRLTHQIIFLTVHRAVDAVESLAAQSSP